MNSDSTPRLSGRVLAVAGLCQNLTKKNEIAIHCLLAQMKEAELIAVAYYVKTGWFMGLDVASEKKFDLEFHG